MGTHWDVILGITCDRCGESITFEGQSKPPSMAPWIRCPACGRMWRADEPTTCACEGPRTPAEVLHGCGKPITGPEFRAYMHEMNRARVEMALTLGTEVTPEEKVFLSNGSLVPGSMEAGEKI